MSKTTRIWLSYLIIFSVLFTIVPISGVIKAANSPIVITDPIGTVDSPAPETKDKINISGSFYGVTDLSYSITQFRRLNTGELVAIQTRDGVEKAYLDGSKFTFYNVQLFEGLNEVTITGKDANGTSQQSDRVYVEYSKLPIITSVKYNTQDLKINNVIQDKLYNDELLIKGDVLNADSIVATINGNATEYTGSVLNNNTYVIAKMPLQRGKNTLTVTAKNNTKTYPVTLDIIYNDGNPYVENGLIMDSTGTYVPLDSTMNITTNDLTVTGSVYNFTLTDQLTYLFNNTSFSITYSDFDTTPVGSIVSTVPGSYTLTKTGVSSFNLYYPTVIQNQLNILQFTFTRGFTNYTQTYNLDQFDPTLNYVTHTSGLTDTTTSKKIDFYIFTHDPFIFQVDHILPDGSTQTLIPISITPQADETMFAFSTSLDPGYNTIVVRPNNSDINMKTYSIYYIDSPDVKVLNLVNGDRVGAGGQETTILAELVNVDLTDRYNTKVVIENKAGPSSYLLDATNFNDPVNPFRFIFDLIGKLQTGANDITIEVNSTKTQTTTRLTVFYFNNDGPDAVLYIDQDRKILSTDTFTPTETPGTFQTEARYVHFKGSYNNAKDIIFYLNGVRVIQEAVQPVGTGTKSAVGVDPITGDTVRLTIDWDNLQFSTDYPIYLHEGPNTFEVEVVSASGYSRSEKVYINREQPPVKLISPNLALTTVVNSNYLDVVVEAANADQVIIDKQEAVYQKLTDTELRNLINILGPQIIQKYDLNGDGYLDSHELSLIDQGEVTGKRYMANVFLKPGKNKIKYEVIKSGIKSKYEFEINYASSPKEGALYKEEFKKNKIQVFDKKVELDFPKNTWLVEPSQDTPVNNEYKSNVYLRFGIVDRQSGKLFKVWDDALGKFILADFNEPFKTIMPVRVIPPDRTGYAGDIYWIDAEGDIQNVDAGLVPTNNGTITLQYNPSIRNDSQNLLAIYHFNRDKQKWVNVGGVVDTRKNTVTAPIHEFGYYTVMAKRGTYNDIIGHSWAANYLQTMFAKGLMMPESYNRFGSDLLTSRGEFSTLLVKALDIPINAGPYVNNNKLYPVNPTFVDVNPLLDPPNGFYSYEYIETAGRAGIIRGLGQGEFSPDGLLTREQAAIMIARAANYKMSSDTARTETALRKVYGDVDKINNYAMPYVLAVTKQKIMSGSESQGTYVFNPRSFMSRAEAAAIAYRLMQDLKKLPK